jgi:hypothetical protein
MGIRNRGWPPDWPIGGETRCVSRTTNTMGEVLTGGRSKLSVCGFVDVKSEPVILQNAPFVLAFNFSWRSRRIRSRDLSFSLA